MAWTFERTRQGYGNMWRSCVIKPGRDTEQANQAIAKILQLETKYRDAFTGAGMPWYIGAAIHYRESSNDLRGCMVNGEKIVGTGQQTTLVPPNRGPYSTFRDSVQDAATFKGWRDIEIWSIERALFMSEIWNGLGYVNKGINAPFVWAGTNHEEPGLFVRDHVFDENVEDQRLGVAAILKKLAEVRPDIAAQMVLETGANSDRPMTPASLPVPALPSAGQSFDTARLLEILLPLLTALLSSRGIQLPAPVQPYQPRLLPIELPRTAPEPPPAPPRPVEPEQPKPPVPILERPSVQLGAAGLGISTILQGLGVIGAPAGIGPAIGAEPTTTGTLATLIPIVTSLFGMTGGFGTIAGLLGNLFNRRKP